MADISQVINLIPTASETFTDNLSASIAAGAATVLVNSAAEYVDGDIVVLTVEPGTINEATFTGTKSGNSFLNCKWTEGNVGVGHAGGAIIIDYDSATHFNMLAKAVSVVLTQQGALKANTVGQAQLLDGSVGTVELLDNAVTQAKMSDNSVGTAEILALNVTKAKLEKAHYAKAYFATPFSHQVVTAAEARLEFTNTDANNFGVLAENLTSPTCQMKVARDGLYDITVQVSSSDGSSSNSFIVWFGVATAAGVTIGRFRHNDRTIAIGVGQSYNAKMWLTAGQLIFIDVYSGQNNIRILGHADPNLATYVAVTEIR